MTLIQKVLLLLFTLHTRRALTGHSSKALFTEVGLIPDSSLYGHLVFPLDMEEYEAGSAGYDLAFNGLGSRFSEITAHNSPDTGF